MDQAAALPRVRATLAEGKVHTHCFPGTRVLDVSTHIFAIQ